MHIVKYKLTNFKCNLTFSSIGEYKNIFKNLNIKKKERAANLFKTRLSKLVSKNLMPQLGSFKDTFDA